MGVDLNVKVYVDLYLTEEGVGLYIAPDDSTFIETVVPYKKLMEDYLEMYLVPSSPPTMHEEDRENVVNLCNSILSALDHLRKIEHDTKPYIPKDRMGY